MEQGPDYLTDEPLYEDVEDYRVEAIEIQPWKHGVHGQERDLNLISSCGPKLESEGLTVKYGTNSSCDRKIW